MSVDTFEIKQGDREPAIRGTITDEATVTDELPDGEAIDLTGCTVEFRFRAERKGSQLRGGAASIVGDPTAGVVKYEWAAGDTDVAGTYKGEFIATRTADSHERTFPSGNATVAWTVRPRLASD